MHACMQAMPITAAYLPIVYSDIVYAPYLPLLTRMLFLANAMIQWSVAGMSSMHCAIGQVQVSSFTHLLRQKLVLFTPWFSCCCQYAVSALQMCR